MRARDYWTAVTTDRAGFLDQLLALLSDTRTRYCVVGGQGVNAYVEPVVSLDLDLVVAVDDRHRLEAVLAEHFDVERFPHSLSLSKPGSDLRIQIRTDPRYDEFVERAVTRQILGLSLPVARVEDVLRGKIWAASDAERRPSKRQKDLADIARLVEAFPDLRALVPEALQRRLL